ncbi:MAG: argininosuccinate lyase [Actinomycetota bacterium]|nr:argininosuccinate lyase [Actinomycetota bacterium]
MKLWGGRFAKETEEAVHAYGSSLSFDRRLAPYDIRVSRAHALALEDCGILSGDERAKIAVALGEMEEELERGTFPFGNDEDIHSAIERVLVERLGDAGAKLRAGRSRNDQVVADLRLYLMDATVRLMKGLVALMEALLEQAEGNMGVIMPGFTHLQPAQPVLLSHHLLAYFEMFKRDVERLREARKRMDRCPLGSGALAGVTLPLDRDMLARESGFSQVTANSMDAVSDRDFVADVLFGYSLAAVHLSRLAEEMIIWANPAFGYLEMDEAYTTGSSIMPQKANPDVAELARGKSGRITGHLVSLLTMLKGLPLAYNRDLQEDKEGLFDGIDQLDITLEVMAGALATAGFDAGSMRKAAGEGFTNATDLADYLVSKGVPFLRAHETAGKLVRLCLEGERRLEELTLKELRAADKSIDEDIYDHLGVEECVKARDLHGGTAPARVEEALWEARRWLETQRV